MKNLNILLIASSANAQWQPEQIPCNQGQGQGYYNVPSFNVEPRGCFNGYNVDQRGPYCNQQRGNYESDPR